MPMKIAIQMARIEAMGAELGAGFFGGFPNRFETGHEIGDDLNDEQNRDPRSMRKQRLDICRGAAAHAEAYENNEKSEGTETGPVLKGGAEADAAIVQKRKQPSQRKSDDEVRQENRASRDAVEFHRIETGNDVTGDASDGDGFPRTHDEVGEGHHPAGSKADRARKDRGSVGYFSGGVGHGDDEFAVDPSDGKQKRSADYETKECAEGAAAEKPVVHDDEPAHAHHGSPPKSEVVGGAELAGECGHGIGRALDERREL